MTYDAVIVGSGLGGLIAGAKLAQEGKSILIVEQHSSIGGYATCFIKNNFTIDVGLHFMDGLYLQDPKIKVFEDLDVYLNVEFVKIEKEFYRFTNSVIDITIPNTIENAVTVLVQEFPEEEKGIKSFFKILETGSYSKWSGKSAGEMLDSLFEDDQLKLILTGTIQYYGDDPYNVSARAFIVALSRNFKGGNHYIRGGSLKLSDYLANYIKDHQGKIVLNKKVTKILINNVGSVYGVEYITTNGDSSITTQVDAKNVILNASINQTAFDLLPDGESTQLLRDAVKQIKIGHSAVNVYLGFNTTLDKLGHHNYLTVVHDANIRKISEIFGNNNTGFSRKNFIFVNYGHIETGMAPSGKSTGVISAIDYIENWDYLSKEEYLIKKKDVEVQLIERLNKLIPGIKEHIEFVSVATPMTMKRYTLNPKGAIIGFARTAEQVKMYPFKSPIENLYFASAWSIPDGGFTSLIEAGYDCATAIIRKRR